MIKIKSKIDLVLSKLLIIIMAVMVINVLWQVFTRFVIQSPSSFTDELSRYLLIWVGLLGASYATGQKLHLSIDLLPTKFNYKVQKYLHILINLSVASFAFFIMIIGGLNLVYITYSLNQYSAALEVSLALIYMVLPLSGLLIVFYSIINLYDKPSFGTF
ncbi:MAG: TRAP transporter small permease [Bacteroidota bacterium]|jgi:TRAP-type C4-dicarboxylate transport system permease small subunit|nr:TRAP transporter small permease [Bacteroidota bacterium]